MSEWAAQVCRGHYKSKICIFKSSQISTKWARLAYKLSSKSSPFWRLILSFFLYQKKLTATEIMTRLVVAPMRGIHGSVYKFYGKGRNFGGKLRVDICSKLWVCFVCLAWLYIDHLVSLSFLARSLIIFNWVFEVFILCLFCFLSRE